MKTNRCFLCEEPAIGYSVLHPGRMIYYCKKHGERIRGLCGALNVMQRGGPRSKRPNVAAAYASHWGSDLDPDVFPALTT